MDFSGVVVSVVRILVGTFAGLFVLSSVIFVHELGHFLVARWAGVLVERFSMGFGPILYSIKWGETEYAISAIPLGGYVKMLGQTDTPEVDERSDDPRSYQSKSVGWRMAIISAGVFMNVVYGFVLFVAAYSYGVPYNPAVIGAAYAGTPAWEAGIREGDRLLAINGVPRNDFRDIRLQVMLTNPRTETVHFKMARPMDGGKETELVFDVRPFKDANGLQPQVGVSPSDGLIFARTSDDLPSATPGEKADDRGFKGGDKLTAVDGVPVLTHHQLNALLFEKRRSAINVTVVRDGDKSAEGATATIRVEPNHIKTLGFWMEIGKIKNVRAESPASRARDAKTGELSPILPNDVIKAVDGNEDFDPMRLPDLITDKAGKDVELLLVREGKQLQFVKVKVSPELVPTWNDLPEGPVQTGKFPLSIPSLGLAFEVRNTVRTLTPNGPAAEQLIQPGDAITKIELSAQEGAKTISFALEIDGNWSQAFWDIQQHRVNETVSLTVQRKDVAGPDGRRIVKIAAKPESDWFFHLRGFELAPAKAIKVDKTILGAVVLGWDSTRSSIIELYLTFRQLFLLNISTKSLSGPVAIWRIVYDLAQWETLGLLLWFAGFLSINLAIINFLPIPILDGGHMCFLTYELIFRRPASDRAVMILNYVGMVLLLTLMVYVVSIDVLRVTGLMKSQ